MIPSNMGRDLILNIRPISELGSRFSRLVSVPASYTLGQLYYVVRPCFTYDMEALATGGLNDNEPYFYIHNGEIDDIDEIMRDDFPTQVVAYTPIDSIIETGSNEEDMVLMPWTCTTVDRAFDCFPDEDTCLFLQMWGWDGPNELIHVIERVGYSTELTTKAKFIGGHGQVSIVNNKFQYNLSASNRFPAELQFIGQRLRSSKVEEEIAKVPLARPVR